MFIQIRAYKAKVCLTQRGMLPLKDENKIVESDGVSNKL